MMVHKTDHDRQHVHLRGHFWFTNGHIFFFSHVDNSEKIQDRWITCDFFPYQGDEFTQSRDDAFFVVQGVESTCFGGRVWRSACADRTQTPTAFCATTTAGAGARGTVTVVIGFVDVVVTVTAFVAETTTPHMQRIIPRSKRDKVCQGLMYGLMR